MPDPKTNTLKPCPFCGSDDVKYDFCGSQGRIICNSCSTYGPEIQEAADPICDGDAAENGWNKRVCDKDEFSKLTLNYW